MQIECVKNDCKSGRHCQNCRYVLESFFTRSKALETGSIFLRTGVALAFPTASLTFSSLVPRSFQKKQYGKIDIVKTEKKGFGVRAAEDMAAFVLSFSSSFSTILHHLLTVNRSSYSDTFIYEYIGEVIGPAIFGRKMKEYANEGIKHFYFMALDKDVVRLLSLLAPPSFSSPH